MSMFINVKKIFLFCSGILIETPTCTKGSKHVIYLLILFRVPEPLEKKEKKPKNSPTKKKKSFEFSDDSKGGDSDSSDRPLPAPVTPARTTSRKAGTCCIRFCLVINCIMIKKCYIVRITQKARYILGLDFVIAIIAKTFQD